MSTPPEGELPPFPLLTIEEAAGVLRIGRSKAYAMAREYLRSGGTSGMPVANLDGCLRVPRWALLELALKGRLVRLCDVQLTDIVGGLELGLVPDDA